jgi:hypothetical protein
MGYWAALISAYTRDFLGPLGHIQPAVCVYKRLPARQGVRDVIKSILAVNNEALNERYLGMPTDVGTSKYGTLNS